MKETNDTIELSEDDLKEIFSLFTSCTVHERSQMYDETSDFHYLKVEPLQEYSVTQEKREFALDARRAIIYFLHLKGYSLCKAGQRVRLDFSAKSSLNEVLQRLGMSEYMLIRQTKTPR